MAKKHPAEVELERRRALKAAQMRKYRAKLKKRARPVGRPTPKDK